MTLYKRFCRWLHWKTLDMSGRKNIANIQKYMVGDNAWEVIQWDKENNGKSISSSN